MTGRLDSAHNNQADSPIGIISNREANPHSGPRASQTTAMKIKVEVAHANPQKNRAPLVKAEFFGGIIVQR